MKHPEPLLLPVGPVMVGGSMTDKVALALARLPAASLQLKLMVVDEPTV